MKIKPCPFCGSDEIEVIKVNSETWSIGCVNQGCAVKPFTNDMDPKNEVIKAWNKRSTMG